METDVGLADLVGVVTPWGASSPDLRLSIELQQLARLRLQGPVASRREGKMIYCSISNDTVRAMIGVLYGALLRCETLPRIVRVTPLGAGEFVKSARESGAKKVWSSGSRVDPVVPHSDARHPTSSR